VKNKNKKSEGEGGVGSYVRGWEKWVEWNRQEAGGGDGEVEWWWWWGGGGGGGGGTLFQVTSENYMLLSPT